MAIFHESFTLRLRGGDVWEAALRLLEPDITFMIDCVGVQGRRGRSTADSLAAAYHDSWQIGRTNSLAIQATKPIQDLTVLVEMHVKNRSITAYCYVEGSSRSKVLGIRESLRERGADGPTTRSKRAAVILDDELILSKAQTDTRFNHNWSGSISDDFYGSMSLPTRAQNAPLESRNNSNIEMTAATHPPILSTVLKIAGAIGGPLLVGYLIYLFGWN